MPGRFCHTVRTVTFTALLAAIGVAGSAQSLTRGVVFLPFENRSDFEGAWHVDQEVPRYLGAYLKSVHGLSVISSAVAGTYREDLEPMPAWGDVKFWRKLRQRFGVRYLVHGGVERFDVSRFVTGQPAVGGYEAFKGEASVSYEVVDLDRLEHTGEILVVARGQVNGEFADRSLAWTLLGKPTQRTTEFRDLNTIRFGSEEFTRTVIGQACLEVARQFSGDLLERIPGLASHRSMGEGDEGIPDSLRITFRQRMVEGKIVFLEGQDAFVDLGSDDGIREGATLPVLGGSDREVREVGTLRVVQIRGPHLSLTRIVTGADSIKTSHMVRHRVIE